MERDFESSKLSLEYLEAPLPDGEVEAGLPPTSPSGQVAVMTSPLPNSTGIFVNAADDCFDAGARSQPVLAEHPTGKEVSQEAGVQPSSKRVQAEQHLDGADGKEAEVQLPSLWTTLNKKIVALLTTHHLPAASRPASTIGPRVAKDLPAGGTDNSRHDDSSGT